MPKFSVIIPLYNKEKHIVATLQSIFAQTVTNYEIIIINDGSTDGSLQVVQNLQDARIKLFSIKNQGVSTARNYAMQHAKGEYYAFLDADDIWLENHLEELNKLITHFPDCGMYCTAYQKQISEKIVINAQFNNITPNHFGIVNDFFLSSINSCIAWTSATCVNRIVFNTVKQFDNKITLGAGEDTDLWIRIALYYPVAFTNNSTAIHNQIADNRISNSNTLKRNFINLDKYNPYIKKHANLKLFLDVNRYSLALQFLIACDKEKYVFYKSNIDFKNLTKKQLFLLHQNKTTLKIFYKIKKVMSKFGFILNSYS